jgi:hypothetical protein
VLSADMEKGPQTLADATNTLPVVTTITNLDRILGRDVVFPHPAKEGGARTRKHFVQALVN